MFERLVAIAFTVTALACATGSGTDGNRCFVTAEHQDRLGALLDGAKLIPVFADGQIYGQQLVRLEPGSHFANLGFQSGDTIVSVNGDPVKSTEGSTYLLCVLGGATAAQLGVERGGAPLELTFQPAS
ncbi:MAG: hypothetical protein AAF430_17910 [Myxococcota bacterium]